MPLNGCAIRRGLGPTDCDFEASSLVVSLEACAAQGVSEMEAPWEKKDLLDLLQISERST